MSEPASLSNEPATDDTVIVDSSVTDADSATDLPDPFEREMKGAADVQPDDPQV